MPQLNLNDPLVCETNRDAVIAFLREAGVEVRREPVAYMTPAAVSAERYAFGEHAGPWGADADSTWRASALRAHADAIENKVA